RRTGAAALPQPTRRRAAAARRAWARTDATPAAGRPRAGPPSSPAGARPSARLGAWSGATARALAALLPHPHAHLDRAADEAEVLAEAALDEPAVGLLQESRREQHEVRRPDARLGGEQDARLLAAAQRRRGARDESVQPGVELPGGDPLLPARQCLLDGGPQPLDVPSGLGRDVHPGRPAGVVELPLDLALEVVAAPLLREN